MDHAHNSSQLKTGKCLQPQVSAFDQTVQISQGIQVRTLQYAKGVLYHSNKNVFVWLGTPLEQETVDSLYVRGVRFLHADNSEELDVLLGKLHPRGVAVITSEEMTEHKVEGMRSLYLKNHNFRQLFVLSPRNRTIPKTIFPEAKYTPEIDQAIKQIHRDFPLISTHENEWLLRSALQQITSFEESQVGERVKLFMKIVNEMKDADDYQLSDEFREKYLEARGNCAESIVEMHGRYWELRTFINKFLRSEWDPLLSPYISVILRDIISAMKIISNRIPLQPDCYEIKKYISFQTATFLNHNIGRTVRINEFMEESKVYPRKTVWVKIEGQSQGAVQVADILYCMPGCLYKITEVEERMGEGGCRQLHVVLTMVPKNKGQLAYGKMSKIDGNDSNLLLQKLMNQKLPESLSTFNVSYQLHTHSIPFYLSKIHKTFSPSLRTLILRYNQMGNYGLKQLLKLTIVNVQTIDLAGNSLTQLCHLAHFHCPELRDLCLDHNNCIGLECVMSLQADTLESLRMSECGMGDRDVMALFTIQGKMKNIRLWDNQLLKSLLIVRCIKKKFGFRVAASVE